MDRPQLARARGVEADRAATSGSFGDLRAVTLKRRRPHHIEAVV
jgi:hypothetical protein